MTLEDLRLDFEAKLVSVQEQFKEVLNDRADEFEIWETVKQMIQVFDVLGARERRLPAVQCYLAGELYFYAREHGMDAALLFKLSRE